MKSKFLRSAVAVGVLAAFSGYAVQASALPLEPFGFRQNTGFVVDDGFLASTHGIGAGNGIVWNEHITGATPSLSPFSGLPNFDTIAWGVPSIGGGGPVAFDPFTAGSGSSTRYSGMRVTGFEDPGSLITGPALSGETSDWGDWVSISRVFHHNQTIGSSSASLTDALIYSELSITHGGTDVVALSPGFLPFKFLETANDGTCEDGAPNGSDCDDLVGFPKVKFDPVFFNFDGHSYHVEFDVKVNLADGTASDFPACPGANPFGPGYECTVWTAEDRTSSLDVTARIREIPEPSTLALLGLSLLGVAGMRKRSAKV